MTASTTAPETVVPFAFPHPEARPENRREDAAGMERDAAALPLSGPIAALVAALGAELTRLVVAEASSHEATPYLRAFGEEAYRLTGSLRGMRAISWKAAALDPRRGEVRRDLINKAWDRVGGEHAVWVA